MKKKSVKSKSVRVKSQPMSDATKMQLAQSAVASAEQTLGIEAKTLTTKERRSRAGALKTDPTIVRLIAQTLMAFNANTAQSILDGLAFAQAMSPVAQATQSLATKIGDAVLDRRATSGKTALVAYQTLRALAKTPEWAHLLPQVQDIEAKLRTGKRAPKAQPSTTAPAPEAAPSNKT